jgi:hypothetical protein
MKDSDFTGVLAVIGLFVVIPVALALMFATSKLGAASIPVWMAVAGAGWLTMRGAVGEALASRFRGDGPSDELHGEAMAELEELRGRMAELEERQDFSERLLAREREARPLGGGEVP